MNIVNNLMNDGYLDEVKANMKRFNDLLDEFKALHISYTEMLDEDAKREDEDKWHQPRCAQITAFLNTVIEWISTMETDTSLSHGGPGDVDTHSVGSDKSGASSSSFTSSTLRISAEAERAASGVRRIKTPYRSRMLDVRESNLMISSAGGGGGDAVRCAASGSSFASAASCASRRMGCASSRRR